MSKEEAAESLRRTIIPSIDNYAYNPNLQNLVFLTKLSAADRALIRFIVTTQSLPSQENTVVRLKPNSSGRSAFLFLSRNCQNIIKNFLQANPLLIKELEVLAPNYEGICDVGSREERQKCMTGRLMGAVPQIPSVPLSSIQEQSSSSSNLAGLADILLLPVRQEQNQLISLVNENRIVIIAGHRGCGKSTQVPQMLLEDCHARSQRCRIICTQPQRLAAHANADRVASERGEIVGQSVGYQIRLESKVSPKTVLTFCTHGVLLRTIFADPTLLNSTTHIIVDEIDEVDLFSRKLTTDGREVQLPMSCDTNKHTCNLLLGILHRILSQYPHLKLILMVNLSFASSILPNGKYLHPSNRIGRNDCHRLQEPILQIQLPSLPEELPKYPYHTGNFLLASQYHYASIFSLKTEQKAREIYFLEDILQWLDFNTVEMESSKRIIQRDAVWVHNMYLWLTGTSECSGYRDFSAIHNDQPMESTDAPNSFTYRNIENLIWILWENLVLRSIYTVNNQVSAAQVNVQPLVSDLLQSISVEWIPVDHKHPETGITPLMLFSAAGQYEVVERLLNMGADVFERVPLPRAALPPGLVTLGTHRAAPTYHSPHHLPMIGANAYDLARLYGHAHVADLLKSHMAARLLDYSADDWEGNLLRFGCWFANPMLRMPGLLHPVRNSFFERNYNDWVERHFNGSIKHRLYQVARNLAGSGSATDFDLLTQLIFKMDSAFPPGGILVFMPSYESIITLKEFLTASSSTSKDSLRQWWIFVLHSRMLVADLKQIFLQPPSGVRKIILSTDIAESSIAITDIAYVIDTGLVRRKEEDPNTGVAVSQNRWINCNSAIQRQYAAQMSEGSKCFHLFSRLRLASLETFMDDTCCQVVCHSMEEACLQAKLLCMPGEKLEACFLSLPRVPDIHALEQSIRRLRIIDAVGIGGDLTEFGSHMCDLPLPPRYSKMVLVSIALKCVDPILTIACILASKNPCKYLFAFILPNSAKERKEAQMVRKKFSADSLSDHMVLLRAFQFWQKARFEGWEQSFCKKNYISAAVFDIVTTVRTQLLGQLRASGFVKARGSGDIRDLNTNSENWAVVKAALAAGMYDNLARVDAESGNLIISNFLHEQSEEQPVRPISIIRPSPLSVLATNLNDSSPVNLKQLPSNWLVYDRLIGQCTMKESDKHGSSSEKRGGSAKAKRCRYQAGKEPKRKLLDCVTVVSPFTTALIVGPLRTPVICMPSEDINSESHCSNYEFLKNKTRYQQNQPLTITDIDSILNNFNTEVPRLETLGMHAPEDNLLKIPDSLVDPQLAKPAGRPKGTVILRLDGPNGILAYECELEVARVISDLRQKWSSLLLRRLRNPGKPTQQQDEALLSTIVAVLSAEEQMLGLRQPSGVGARPRPMATELCNQNDTAAPDDTPSTIIAPCPFPSSSDNTEVKEAHSETSNNSRSVPLQLPQTFKQQPTRLSLGVFAPHKEENKLVGPFLTGGCGDTNKSQERFDTTCNTLHHSHPDVWGDILTDHFAQLGLATSHSSTPERTATHLKLKDQISRRLRHQQDLNQCCGNASQMPNDVHGCAYHPADAAARQVLAFGANSIATYTDKSTLDNFCLTNLDISFGSLQPLG